MSSSGDPFPWDSVRLPSFVRAVGYRIHLTADLTALTASGTCRLVFRVTEDTRFVVFHAKNMELAGAELEDGDNAVARLLEDRPREQVYLETREVMRPGVDHTVNVTFRYEIRDTLSGFYHSTYTTKADSGTSRA